MKTMKIQSFAAKMQENGQRFNKTHFFVIKCRDKKGKRLYNIDITF